MKRVASSRRRYAVAAGGGAVVGVACRLVAASAATGTLDGRVATLVLLAFTLPAATGRARLGPGLACSVIAGMVAMLPSWDVATLAIAVSAMTTSLAFALRRRPSRGHGAAGAVATMAVAAWLLWPIWLAPALAQSGVDVAQWATRLHPVFAIDAVTDGVPWTEQAHIYAITPLGSDVAIALPQSAWPATLMHGATATALACFDGLRIKRRRRRRTRARP